MGIASAIFWIALGFLYVLYQALKERPGETLQCIVLFGLLSGGIIAWNLVLHALLDWNISIAIIFAVISFSLLTWYVIHINLEASKKRKAYEDRFSRALKIAQEEPIDEEDLKKFEELFWKNSPCSHDVYAAEKTQYIYSKDKSKFRDLIVKDYIENHKVYKILRHLE